MKLFTAKINDFLYISLNKQINRSTYSREILRILREAFYSWTKIINYEIIRTNRLKSAYYFQEFHRILEIATLNELI